MIYDRIDNPNLGRFYSAYPTLENNLEYRRIRYGSVGDMTTEHIHMRRTLGVDRTTRVITSDSQAPFKPMSYVLLGDGLYQISTMSKSVINPRALSRRYRYILALVEVENPLKLRG